MGLANILTIIRILLVPVLIITLVYRYIGVAFGIFCIASLTDCLDGYIARTTGRQTMLGSYLDPLADKLLLAGAFITLTTIKIIPFWITAVVISRDILIILGAAIIHIAGGNLKPTPTITGKATTFMQIFTILIALLLQYSFKCSRISIFVYTPTAILTIVSGLQYIYLGSKMFNLNTHK